MKQLLLNNPKTSLFCIGCVSALAMAPVYLWPLLMLGYSTLLYVLHKIDGFKVASLYTFIFFLGYFCTGLYWTSSSLFVEFDRWWWALPFSFAGLPILLSLIPASVLGLTGFFKKFKTIAIVLALMISDIIRSFFLTGFPWNMPVYTWTHNDFMMGLLPHLGLYPLNSLTTLFFCLPALILLNTNSQSLRHALTLILLVFCFVITIVSYPAKQPDTIPDNIVMVQANIPQKEKWDPKYSARNLQRYIIMSQQAIYEQDPTIIIWPETAISQNLLSYPSLKHQFYAFLDKLPENSYLITGYLYRTQDGVFNALAILDKTGEIQSIYNKHHLVPFGEYMPFGLDTITGVSNFQKGPFPESVSLGQTDIEILPLICYEIIFPSYAAQAHENSIIVNITNDAWFGKTAGPYQHFDHAIFRATESQKPLLRLSGNGVSAIINSNGEVIKSTKLNSKDIIITN